MVMALILALAMAGPAEARKELTVPINAVLVTARERRRRDRQRSMRCRTARYVDGDVAALQQRGFEAYEIQDIADDLARETSACERDLDLAITILEGLAAPDAMQTAEPEAARSLHFALIDRGRPGDAARATDIARMLWLRGFVRAPELPAWTDAERLAFITRDDIWRWLSIAPGDRWMAGQQRLAALRDRASPRYDPVAALVLMETINPLGAARLLLAGEEVPHDAARAERLLGIAARYDERARLVLTPIIAERMTGLTGIERRNTAEPLRQFMNEQTSGGAAARTVMVPILIDDLANATAPEQERAVVGELQTFVSRGTPDAEGTLLAWAAPHLRDADPATQRLAFSVISTLLRANNAAARVALDAEMARAGIVDRPPLTLADLRSGAFITDDDYPWRALREEREGVVEGIATIDPSGRVIAVLIVRSAGEQLDNEVIRTAMRRIRVQPSVTNGRYVRAALPQVHFLLPEDERPVPVAAPPAGAIIVRGRLIQRQLLDVPIPVTTVSP